MAKVQYYCGCGCALLEDGRCPTCAEGGAKLGAEERLSSDRAAADQISDLLTAREAQSARIESLEGCLRLARGRMSHILDTAEAGMTHAEVRMTQDVIAQLNALLPPPPTRAEAIPFDGSGPDGPVADSSFLRELDGELACIHRAAESGHTAAAMARTAKLIHRVRKLRGLLPEEMKEDV